MPEKDLTGSSGAAITQTETGFTVSSSALRYNEKIIVNFSCKAAESVSGKETVNTSIVPDQEFLSDNIYEFDTRIRKLTIAYDAEGVLVHRNAEKMPDRLLDVPEIGWKNPCGEVLFSDSIGGCANFAPRWRKVHMIS